VTLTFLDRFCDFYPDAVWLEIVISAASTAVSVNVNMPLFKLFQIPSCLDSSALKRNCIISLFL